MRIRPQAYSFSDDDIDFVTTELGTLLRRQAFLTSGHFVEEFESRFAAAHGRAMAVAVNSGSAALESILRALDVKGGEVVVPTNTFAATAFAVIRAGAVPVFADVCGDLTLDPKDAVRRMGPNTKAVVTVHIGGLISPRTREIADMCARRSVPLIEDAAHAHGSRLLGQAAGSFGVAAAFSFFPTKVLTSAEGGMVVTSDSAIRDTVRLLRDQGKGDDGIVHEAVGANWRMSEPHALLGIAQLRHLDEFLSRRAAIAERYKAGLADVSGLSVLGVPEEVQHNFYKLVVFVDGVSVDVLLQALRRDHEVDLGGFVYRVPLHQQPPLRSFARGPLPVAEELCARHICPPIYPSLTDEEVDYVVDAIKDEVAALTGA